MVTVNKSGSSHTRMPFSSNRTTTPTTSNTPPAIPQRQNNPVTGGCSTCGQRRRG